MLGIRHGLRRRGYQAEIWDDASVFGDIDCSVERLCRRLGSYSSDVRVVTHSFGDWLFRQAYEACHPAVPVMVSLVPVMRPVIAARLVAPLGRIFPEIAVMANAERAASAIHLPADLQRLVVWARFDPWTRRADLSGTAGTRCTEVLGTHNSILWQPSVYDLIASHFEQRDS